MKRMLGWLLMMCLLAACSDPDQGPPLGPFAAITKTETDKPFDITPPSSRSPAPFTYTSSDPKVATIAGSTVTITGPGVSTITAAQAAIGSYGPTSASTTLTVTAVPCDAGSTRIGGVCTAIPTCIPPAMLSNNTCVVPPNGASKVTTGSLTWMGVSNAAAKWADARDFCAGSTIEGTTGWRQPTQAELQNLYASAAIAGHGWALGNTWSSTMGITADSASHMAVDLNTGLSVERADTANSLIACVHPAG
jgi:hypothetical protein